MLSILQQSSNKRTARKKSENKVSLIISDVHRPFHNAVLWDKVLQLIRDLNNRLDSLVLAGDYLDLFTLGSYNADSLSLLQGIDLDFEYRDGLDGITELEHALHPGVKKKYLYGNHEDRYFRTINSKDNAKFGAALKHPTEALCLIEKGWEVKENWTEDFFHLEDDLIVLHGKFWNTHSAHAHASKLPYSSIFGHTHRFGSYHWQGKTSYNIGGLYDKANKAFYYKDWITRMNWQNGFCLVHHLPDGWIVELIECRDNSFTAAGRVY